MNLAAIMAVTCQNEEIHSKMKALECSQHFPNCKSIEIFPDAKGQLTTLSDLVQIRTRPRFYGSPGYLQE